MNKKKSYKSDAKYRKIYMVWEQIKARCLNSNHKSYHRYGGRGITVCDEWTSSAKAFIEWSLSNGYKEGLHTDRIDNDKGYSPDNCRFVTQAENNKNTRLLASTNTSGYRGVVFFKPTKKWMARVSVNNKSVFIGYAGNKIDCAAMRDSYVISKNLRLPLNFPQPIACINAIMESENDSQD